MRKTIIIVLVLAGLAVGGYFIYTKWIYKDNAQKDRATSNSEIEYYHCGMHPWITSDKPGKCPICGMDLTPVYKGGTKNGEGIVSIDPVMEQNIGVKTEMVTKRKLTHTIRTTGRADYDETTQTVITSKFSGWIEKLYVDYTGKTVSEGQPLYDIYSPDLVAAQQEYVQAMRYKATMKSANDSAVSSGAEALLQSARRKLLYWDVSPSQVKELEEKGNIKKTLTIYSPYSGTVVEKNIFEGMQVQAGLNLLKLANVSKMWIYADVYENELSWVTKDEKAIIELPGISEKLEGKISYIYPYLQDQTRTARVRIDYSDRNQLLKKDMYVTVNIIPTVTLSAIAIPEQSVIHSGNRDIVVMSLGKGKFMSMEVKLGALSDGYYQVLDGLKENDVIVTSSQFLIDSESNLKAGASAMEGMNMGGMKMNSDNKGKQVDTIKKNSTSAKVLYTCPMHPEVISDKPGNCPKCGMTLVKKTN